MILWGITQRKPSSVTPITFSKMKQNGTRFIVVDPRYSDTVSSLADQWIPLLPTTDNALMDAMMYVIISENLHDKTFIDTYTLGFDENSMPEGVPANESLVAYLLAQKMGYTKRRNGQKNYPRSSTIHSSTGTRLRHYKTRSVDSGMGPQRHICGERTARGSIYWPRLPVTSASKVAGRQVTAVVLIVNSALDQICQKIRYKRKSRL